MTKKSSTLNSPKLPLVFVHIHLTAVAPTLLPALVPLRDAIQAVIEQHADQYGLRIKRRRVSAETGGTLWSTYESRAKVYNLID
jgi:hypothetical protein